MVIEISADLFKEPNNLQDVNYLLTIFSEKRRYNFYCEFEEIKKTEVFGQLISIQKELIEENFNYIINQSIEINYVVDSIASEVKFNIEEAKRFFIQPSTLVLENSLNDGYFVDALLRNFKNKSKIIKRHKDNGWLIYGNGGGADNIINYINGLMNSFEALPKENHKYLKCMVLIDSDNEFQTNAIKANRQKLFDFLDGNNIPYHQLEKREIENYIPDEVLKSIPEIDEYIETYLSLSPLQKDYFDLEKGFNNKNLNGLSTDIQNLYTDLEEAQIKILRKGMTIAKYEKDKNFKAEFPKLFEDEKTTQESLKARTVHQIKHPNELTIVLDEITKIL